MAEEPRPLTASPCEVERCVAAGVNMPKDLGQRDQKWLPRVMCWSPLTLGRKCTMLCTVPAAPGCGR